MHDVFTTTLRNKVWFDLWGARQRTLQAILTIAIGAFARRWFGVEGVTKPRLPNMERWFAGISQRPGFLQFIAPPMS